MRTYATDMTDYRLINESRAISRVGFTQTLCNRDYFFLWSDDTRCACSGLLAGLEEFS